MNVDPIMQGAVLALASGRIAYSLVADDIFRGLREWVWMRSAPEAATVRRELAGGGWENLPAAMFHEICSSESELRDIVCARAYDPVRDPRPAGFAGQVFECVYCMSAWTSLGAAITWALLGDAAVVVAAPFALWAIANLYAAKGL